MYTVQRTKSYLLTLNKTLVPAPALRMQAHAPPNSHRFFFFAGKPVASSRLR